MAYTTTAQVKEYLNITGAGDDALIARLITAAQSAIDQYCNQPFEATADTTRYFDDLDLNGSTLYLDYPLVSVTTITNGDGEAVESDDYKLQPRNRPPYHRIITINDGSWYASEEDEISITGRWAYSLTAPADIVQACIRLTSFLYRQRDTSADLDRTVITEGVTLLPGALPQDVLTLLANYVRY